MSKKDLFRMLLTVCFMVFVAASVVCAAGGGKAYGVLTSFERDNTVLIRDDKGHSKGYLLSPSVDVQGARGGPISLSSLPPSSYIYFEYKYGQNGFVIYLIKEIPR